MFPPPPRPPGSARFPGPSLPARGLSGPPDSSHSQLDGDASIRQTDSDAALARLSAVQKGYLQDSFIKGFVSRTAQRQLGQGMPPLINVGTYLRTVAIDELVERWLEASGDDGCQIVSLGSGSDTRFWRMSTGPHASRLASYIEVDFPEMTTSKAMAIRKSKELSAILGDQSQVKVADGGTALHAPKYHLIGLDLRGSAEGKLSEKLAPILDSNRPTVLLFECVLVYMQPEASQALLRWFLNFFSTAGTALGGVIYEMFGLGDSFGKVLINNMKARSLSLPGAEPYPTKASLPSRFLSLGFTSSRAVTLRDIRRSYVLPSEMQRVARLEMLDEIEELELVLEHYAITWGIWVPQRDTRNARDSLRWGLKPVDDDDGQEDSDTPTEK